MAKKIFSLFLILFIVFCLTSCGIINRLRVDSEINEYPRTIKSEFKAKSTSAPDIIYNTTGEENGLINSIYWFIGTVKEISSIKMEDEAYADVFILSTDKGDVLCYDLYNFTLNAAGDQKSLFEEKGADYSFPDVGERVKVYACYQGYSEKMKMPSVVYGVPEWLFNLNNSTTDNDSEDESDINDGNKNNTSAEYTKENENKPSIATYTTKKEKSATNGEKNALDSAKSYLKYSAFSYSGLINQLEYEGFTHKEAVYAVDNCGADWFEQAVLSAKSYLKYSSFSYDGLVNQLEYEGFTHDQAVHGADSTYGNGNSGAAAGKNNALESAKSYLKYSAFSYSGLIDQLEYEGFTHDEAVYAVDNCGANWFEQAAKSAESYLKYSSFTRTELIEQLEYEGFTYDQAVYGVEKNGK